MDTANASATSLKSGSDIALLVKMLIGCDWTRL
jgi:hypothetical protein